MLRKIQYTLFSTTLLFAACKQEQAASEAQKQAASEMKAPAPTPPPAAPKIDRQAVATMAKQMFGTVVPSKTSEDPAIEDARVNLGRTLYYDTRLSKAQDMSCNTCHDLAQYGIDVREKDGARMKTSMGHGGAFGTRNSPTVYNAFANGIQFWDGRAKDVEEQAKGPILNPVEMAIKDDKAAVAVVKSIPGYKAMFAAAFPGEKDPITFDNLAKAIGAFERKLVTPAPFDEFIAGKMDALTDEQVEGLDLFIKSGCTTCHMGPAFGGSILQKLGLMKPWPTEDTGRFEVTKNETDKYFFKASPLRNIEKTGPYLHDGSMADLKEVIAKMAEHQTPTGALAPEKVERIMSFLQSLTGKIDEEFVKQPELPKSGPKTPKPRTT